MNRELPSISKLTYTTHIVVRFSIVSIFACMYSHILSIFASSLCLISLSLRFTSLPSSFWSHLLSLWIFRLASNLHLRLVVDLSSSNSCAPLSYLGRTLLKRRWLGIRDSSRESWESEVCMGRGQKEHRADRPYEALKRYLV